MNKAKLIFPFLTLVFLFSNCSNHQSAENRSRKTGSSKNDTLGLYKVVIFYPKTDSTRFDMEYYENNHMPMMARILGDNLEHYEIDNGKVESNSNPRYIAIGSFYVKDIGKFNDSISANPDSVGKDIPKYTNEKPLIQTFTVKKIYN